MAKNENKTQKTEASVTDFLESVADEKKKADSYVLLEMMKHLSGSEAKMWGPSLVGFGTYHYKYASGREGSFFRIGFSPRQAALTVYIMPGFERFDELMQKLGKYKTGKSCLYIKKLEDVDQEVLKTLIVESLEYMAEKYPD
ncbi:MAG: hypothetical protein CMP59_02145 [Flavobacteriales bacterium]|nr:hypothetical protein [Flavobacteriales bacterium]|tara:strand:+ start:452 stop:877 length:426 start_codon:yes stop_codon:yes gene_type:complete